MTPNKKDLVNELCNPNSILVISKTGIYRLSCPFKARCIEQVDFLQPEQIVSVIAVIMSKNLCLLYVVKNKAYYHHYFMIIGR
jgi:hypothetical protein